ncbi:MAG: DUF1501 domain-containing protein [Pirellulales bacterium]|nr:DUF1501 domain-containing protein [Pirellulales bacterium]
MAPMLNSLDPLLTAEMLRTRRMLLRAGALATLNWSWPAKAGRNAAAAESDGQTLGKAKSCILIFLFGGPSQQDLWDLKPDAAAEVRGEFKPIDTRVPGMQIGEHLPQLAQQSQHFTIIRSMRHTDFEHGSASYTALTGQPHPLPGTNTPARPEDFPTYGSVVGLKRPVVDPVPDAVVLGPVMHQGNRPPMAGQNAGFLGRGYDPFRIVGDPNQVGFHVPGLQVKEDITARRLGDRRTLLSSLNHHSRRMARSKKVAAIRRLHSRAYGLLKSSQSQQALDVEKESAEIRDRYGRHKFGQTLLLSRRLVESGVPLIQVNWSRSNADQWDTHAKNYPRLRKMLPAFDQGLAALLEDLQDRRLLDSTMVICLGEFGRTPRMNKDAGRDHWPDCYSAVVAGGGLKMGQIVGASDRMAAYPTSDPIAPWDLSATMFDNLGILPADDIHDLLGRPFRISRGRVLRELF